MLKLVASSGLLVLEAVAHASWMYGHAGNLALGGAICLGLVSLLPAASRCADALDAWLTERSAEDSE